MSTVKRGPMHSKVPSSAVRVDVPNEVTTEDVFRLPSGVMLGVTPNSVRKLTEVERKRILNHQSK